MSHPLTDHFRHLGDVVRAFGDLIREAFARVAEACRTIGAVLGALYLQLQQPRRTRSQVSRADRRADRRRLTAMLRETTRRRRRPRIA